jgi:hypothetical protein
MKKRKERDDKYTNKNTKKQGVEQKPGQQPQKVRVRLCDPEGLASSVPLCQT